MGSRRKKETGKMGELVVDLEGIEQLSLLGANDANLRFLEERTGGTLVARGDRLIVRADAGIMPVLEEVFADLCSRVRKGQVIDEVTLGAMLAGVAGIMVFISLDELFPAAREYGEGHWAIYGLVAGMAIMA